MKITTARLKEIIKEEIAEARLPDTMGAGFGDPQDDEREDAMGPRVPHEFQITGMWEKDLAGFIRNIDDYLKSLKKSTSNEKNQQETTTNLGSSLSACKGEDGKDWHVGWDVITRRFWPIV